VITAEELADLRLDAVREMPDLVRILRRIEDVINPTTLVSETAYSVVYDDVAAFVTRNVRSARFVEQAGRPLEADDYTVIIDPAATDVRNGDVIEVVASGDEDTPDLVVMSITAGSATAGRRVFASRFGEGQVEAYVVVDGEDDEDES